MSEPPVGVKLEYEATPALRRNAPAWVWAIVAVYLLLWLGVLSIPLWSTLISPSDADFNLTIAGTILLFAGCAIALLLTPVRVGRQRPLSRKSFLIPLIASATLFAALVFGAGIALIELAKGDSPALYAVLGATGTVWLAWTIVFWLATRSRDPLSLAGRFHRWLLGGSVAELLVAVPSHIAVTMRGECCGGIATGTAICLGAMVMFVSFGPSVMLLYLKRVRQIRRPVK